MRGERTKMVWKFGPGKIAEIAGEIAEIAGKIAEIAGPVWSQVLRALY